MMNVSAFLFVVVMFITAHGVQAVEDQSPKENTCFPGLVYENQSHSCQCANSTLFEEGVLCDNGVGKVAASYCVTYDRKSELVVGGVCPYPFWSNVTLSQFATAPPDINSISCEVNHRNGTLCGQCADGYGVAINSYLFHCFPAAECKPANVLMFLLVRFGPLTLFYIFIFLFKINVASSYTFSYVLYAQMVLLFLSIWDIRIGLATVIKSSLVGPLNRLIIAFYSVWILDVFSTFVLLVCIGTEVTNAKAISFQYIPALYPIFLIFCSYVMVKLHDRNWTPIRWIPLPVKKLAQLFCKKIDFTSSLLTTFTTFFFLSFSKITLTSVMLLSYARLITPNGSVVRTVFLYDGDMDYFGPDHLPYALLAIMVILTLLLPSLALVFLYPMKSFQRFLVRLLSSRRIQALNAFMDVLQGHLKDGLEGGRDYRYFSGFQLLWRMLAFEVYYLTVEYQNLNYLIMTFGCSLWAWVIFYFSPYKRGVHNMFEGATMMYFNIIFALSLYSSTLQLINRSSIYVESLLYALVFFPSIAAVVVFLFTFKGSCRFRKNKKRDTQQDAEVSDVNQGNDGKALELENSAIQDRFAEHIGYGSF